MTKAEVARAQKMRSKGATYSQIAEKLGVSDSTVRRWLNKPYPSHDKAKRLYNEAHGRTLKPKVLVEHKLASVAIGRRRPPQVTTAKLNKDLQRVEEAEAEVFEALVPEKRSKIAQWWRDFRKALFTFDDEEPNLG